MAVTLVILGCSNNPTSSKRADQKNDTTESSLEELAIYQDAIIALNDGDLGKAEQLFLEMSTRQPNLSGPWANLALIQVKKGNLALADSYVKNALDKNSTMPQALNLSGYLAQRQGDINQAKSYYLQAITQKSDYALAHYNVALIYDVYLQDIEAAISHYQLYLSHIEQKDKATEDWLENLQATMAASN